MGVSWVAYRVANFSGTGPGLNPNLPMGSKMEKAAADFIAGITPLHFHTTAYVQLAGIPVLNSFRGSRIFRIKSRLICMLFVDIGPSSLCMADEIYLRIFFQHMIKAFEPISLHSILPVNTYWNIIILSQLVHLLYLRRITFNPKF